ncbi:helix-turn-helix domain-containing protein [Cytobacillus sp. FSL W7-1323]|uniref:helix-turn-helix domain-containing protein n=1 Tax=Cytobacillus sp. FSL W7-1323 TaxID=2921700 RepID=UPI00315818B6
MNRETLTVQEAAVYIGVCKDTIYTMVKEKQIPHVKARTRILFRVKTLDAWMREQEQQNLEAM